MYFIESLIAQYDRRFNIIKLFHRAIIRSEALFDLIYWKIERNWGINIVRFKDIVRGVKVKRTVGRVKSILRVGANVSFVRANHTLHGSLGEKCSVMGRGKGRSHFHLVSFSKLFLLHVEYF
jgi:hypothetical protein